MKAWVAFSGGVIFALRRISCEKCAGRSNLHQPRHYVGDGFIFAALFCAAAGDVGAQPAPSSAPPPPPQIIIPEGSPPPLAGAGLPVTDSVPRFIDWAGRSGIGQREAVRRQIASARGNPAVAQELCREGSEAQKQDHS